MDNFEDYMTAKAAAEEIGIEYKTLLMRISRGTVNVAKVVGINKLIHRDEVARVKSLESAR